MTNDEGIPQKNSMWLAVFMGVLGLLSGVVTVVYQIYIWLKNGEWLPIYFYDVFQWLGIDYLKVLNIKWVGVQKILMWILELPLSLMCVVSGLALGYLIGLMISEFALLKN